MNEAKGETDPEAGGELPTVLVMGEAGRDRSLLKSTLELDGFRVLEGSVSADAIRLSSEAVLDAILIDVGLPDMIGFSIIQELRGAQETSEIPVLFVSRDAVDGDCVRIGMSLGARDFIPKPLSKPELLARIGSVVNVYRMERKLRALNRELEELNRRQREYLSMATHDLKVPLHSATTYCKLLLEGGYGPMSSEQAHAVTRIRTLVSYMRVLVSNLLDLEKIERGRMAVMPNPEDPCEILTEAVDMNRSAAQERGIRLERVTDGGLGEPMLDRQQVLQVLNNLIGNAIKFCPAGSRVEVGARIEGENIVLWVEDDGPGIPEREQGLLFRPFQQLSTKSKSRDRGSGLGLWVVQKLVEAHGGEIKVRSAPGAGSRFELALPVRGPYAGPRTGGIS